MRERIEELKQKIDNNGEFQTEIKQVSGWFEEKEVSFAEYNDDIVRYLVERIYVTEDLKLIITIKGGQTIVEEIYTTE